jgi:[acyl-carrier-protein] S-malonyltransferase
VLAVLSPGQGSQKPGFLTPWLDLPGTEARLRWWSALAGVDLVHLGTKADADEIKDTARTQPLLVAAACSPPSTSDVRRLVSRRAQRRRARRAGCSPPSGDHAAGVRGREMAAACALEPTGMAAILGGEESEVLAAIAAHGLYPANRNGAGQIVAAGALDALDKLAAEPPAKARVIKLAVAGAFHTPAYPAEPLSASPGHPDRRADPLSNSTGGGRHGRDPPAWSARSPRRYAGTSACAPWPTSG